MPMSMESIFSPAVCLSTVLSRCSSSFSPSASTAVMVPPL